MILFHFVFLGDLYWVSQLSFEKSEQQQQVWKDKKKKVWD
jgi:hypothetical protein